VAHALNNAGSPLIVGWGLLSTGARAYRRQGQAGKAEDLNAITSGIPKGVTLVAGWSVSDSRYIAGQCDPGPTVANRACLLIPQR
jgi:hypothetical protein